jgi:hypothetical protein
MVGLLGRVISPSQGLYLHRTTQHRKTRTYIHVLSEIRTHDPSNQPAKTHASDSTATVTGNVTYTEYKCTGLVRLFIMRALHNVQEMNTCMFLTKINIKTNEITHISQLAKNALETRVICWSTSIQTLTFRLCRNTNSMEQSPS